MSAPKVVAAPQDADAPDQQPGFKVFVGNMSYQTRESEVHDIFAKIGAVRETHLVFRGPYSMGIAFVTFEREEDADRAVAELNGYEFDKRKFNVERAHPRADRTSPPEGVASPSNGGMRRGGSWRGGPRGGFRRGGRRFGGGAGNGNASRRQTGPPSDTTIFVGNLPFNVVDEDLYNIFADYNVTEARVVRFRDNSSKGIAFVTVASPADQARALEDLVDARCDDRKLIIRAAYSSHPYEGAEQKGEEGGVAVHAQ